jgi:AsmA protein
VRAAAVHHRPGRSGLAILGYAALGLACLALGAVTFLALAQPLDGLRQRVLAELKATTGRELAIGGATSLSLVPRPALTIEDVALPAPAGAEPLAPRLSIARLDVELGLLSLLAGAPRVTRVVLTRPQLELTSEKGDEKGSAKGEPSLMHAAAAARGAPQAQARSRLGTLGPLSVRIIDGRLRYPGGEANQEIGGVNLDAALEGADGPLHAAGSFMLRGEKLAFDASLSSPAALLHDASGEFALRLAGQAMKAAFTGEVSGDGGELSGRLELTTGSVRALAALLGRPLGEAPDPGPLHLEATLGVTEGRLTLAGLNATVGTTAVAGDVVLQTARARPLLSGTLQLAELDLARLLLRPAAAPSPASQDAAGANAAARAAHAEEDWSEERIDLSALALADTDLRLAVDRIAYKDLKTGPSNLTFALADKFAKLTLDDVQLYDGRGQGVITLDATSRTPAIGANLTLDGVSALPLVQDALGFGWLEGRGSVSLALAGQGASVRQLVSALNGKLSLSMSNGAVRGADFSKVLHAIEQARLDGLGQGDKTQFSEFGGTFLITSGIAQNQDLRLISPRLQLSGAGTVSLARRSIDYTLRTRIVGGVASPGAVINVGNLEIPLHIEGPWAKPAVSVVGQENLTAAVKQIGKSLNSPEVQDALKGLLGGDQHIKPSDLLDKLFKKQP